MTSNFRNVTAKPTLPTLGTSERTARAPSQPQFRPVRDGFETTAVRSSSPLSPAVDKAVKGSTDFFEKILKDFGDGTPTPPFDDPVKKLEYLDSKVGALFQSNPEVVDQIKGDSQYQSALEKLLGDVGDALKDLPDGPLRSTLEAVQTRLLGIKSEPPEEPGPSRRDSYINL